MSLEEFKKTYWQIKKRINYLKYIDDLPVNHQCEDIYLVSFPKSGNTWLRFLIANCIIAKYNLRRNVNFFSIHDLIPDIGISRKISLTGLCGVSNLPRIIKSHCKYNPYYHRVIFLVRNPRNVMLSYYYYLRVYKKISENLSLSDFIRSKKFGISAWKTHVMSWSNIEIPGQIIKFVFYEDLQRDSVSQLESIMNLIGINVEKEHINEAVKLSNKNHMSKSEINHMSTQLIRTQETPFVRKANIDNNYILSVEDNLFIENEVKELAEILGYKYN